MKTTDPVNTNQVIKKEATLTKPQPIENLDLPPPGPIDLSVLDRPPEPNSSAESSEEVIPVKKQVSPFRSPNATKNLVGETEANRVSLNQELKDRLEQVESGESGIIARPPSP